MLSADLGVVADPTRLIASPTENICVLIPMFADIGRNSAFYQVDGT